MATLDEYYGQLWWDPARGAVQDDRPGYAAPAPAAPTRDFLEGSTNLYRDEGGVIRNLRESEAAPAPAAAPGGVVNRAALSPLAARYAQSLQPGGPALDDPFGIARAAMVNEQRAAEMRAYAVADQLAQFLPPERIRAETARLTGVDLGANLATTPKLQDRVKATADIAKTRADTEENIAKRRREDEKFATERRETAAMARQSYQQAVQGLDTAEETARRILANPALGRAAGPIAGGWTPTITQGAKNIEADLESLKGRLMIDVLQSIRAASATGGGVGSLTEKEGERLANSISSLDIRQSPEALRQSLDRIILHTHRLREMAQEGYAAKYGSEAARTAAPDRGRGLPAAARSELMRAPEGEPQQLGNGQVWVKRNGQLFRMR